MLVTTLRRISESLRYFWHGRQRSSEKTHVIEFHSLMRAGSSGEFILEHADILAGARYGRPLAGERGEIDFLSFPVGAGLKRGFEIATGANGIGLGLQAI